MYKNVSVLPYAETVAEKPCTIDCMLFTCTTCHTQAVTVPDAGLQCIDVGTCHL